MYTNPFRISFSPKMHSTSQRSPIQTGKLLKRSQSNLAGHSLVSSVIYEMCLCRSYYLIFLNNNNM